MVLVVFSKRRIYPNFFGIYQAGTISNYYVMGPKGEKYQTYLNPFTFQVQVLLPLFHF